MSPRMMRLLGQFAARGAGVAGLLCVCLGVGCQPETAGPVTPEATLIAFARALNQGKFEDAYALMSDEYRARVNLSQFKRSLSENPQETAEVSNALGHVQKPPEQRAVVAYDDDAELELTRRGDRWFIASDVVDFYDQTTPRAALRAFVRAMERKRYDVVLRLVPDADKEGITAERMEQAWSGQERERVERMLTALRENLQAPIEVIGNRATMPYGEHMQVQFVREGQAWKIEDPE
jgi:hypothetical protein